ncbi:MAG TPA: GDP-mannose 4,6-dehydratase [Oceanospirillales bacterium]|nr:GDP-mannose 4,6-dehydratase [Oceanospirillales bacterium]
MLKKVALITGTTGQDGSLLAQFLLNLGYNVIAPTRKNPDVSRLKSLAIDQHPNLQFVTYKNWLDFEQIISRYVPDEIYHLAAMSHVGQSHLDPEQVLNVNTVWTSNLLKFAHLQASRCKFFFASSCEIYSSDLNGPVSENAHKHPTNPYGISKLSGHLLVEYYRQVKGLFACNGILFNHESNLRNPSFVSKKICQQVAKIVKKGKGTLYLGNIEAKKDWGYAPDYIKLFHPILQQAKADDYNISTGILHSVQDMVNCAFLALDFQINWHGNGINTTATDSHGNTVVAIDEKFYRPMDNRYLLGDNSKALKQLKMNNLTPFKQWVKSMTLTEYHKLT